MNNGIITSILIDDEQGSIDNLALLLSQFSSQIEVKGSAHNVTDAYALITRYQPDVVFLDIQLKNESGFDLLKRYDDIPFQVIFVTAYDRFGIQAVKFSALDYILKPIDLSELETAVGRLKQRIGSPTIRTQVHNLKDNLLHPGEPIKHKIALPGMKETQLVSPDQILYCRSDNSYADVFFLDGSKKLVCRSIKEFELLLVPYGFLRVHQRYLINLQHVKSFSKTDGLSITLIDHSEIPVSRNKREFVLKVIRN